ncbi:MAG: CotH kinase family protein [Pirellulales bacterium]|nr:CotH kinase family protein [Pirellulales bacterium]
MLDGGPLVISEFCALNDDVLADADGDSSDWIEIHNPTSAPVDLEGWSLTDDPTELTQWRFPAVLLAPDAYLVVFASGKDRLDPAELHTSFRLDADGEYLALVRPDGATVSHEFAPAFPRQEEDVSYGAVFNRAAFPFATQGQAYRVPTAEDAALGTAWTTAAFDDAGWARSAGPSPVLITEVGTADDFVEIQNVSGETVDTSGWVVAVNYPLGDEPIINHRNTILWTLPEEITADQILYRHDDADDPEHYWGENIAWGTAGPGWAMLVDDAGDVVDLVVWGYTGEEISSMVVAVGGFAPTAADAWLGEGAARAVSSGVSLQRRGTADHDDATDWAFVAPIGMGEANQGLVCPFPRPQGGGIGFDLSGGGLAGAVAVDVAEAMHGISASLWTRIPFEVGDRGVLETMQLRIRYNDGFVAYLNGREIARRNAPADAGWNAAAPDSRSVEDSLLFEPIDVTEGLDWLVEGTNVLAVHGLNAGAADGDFLILPELTATSRRYFVPPSPGEPNGPGYRGFVGDTKFSVDRGFYDGPVTVEITTDTPGATIRYTTDGRPPTETTGIPYTLPLTFGATTVLRAAAFLPDYYPSNVDTQTYLINESAAVQSLPVISLVADPVETFSVEGLWSDVLLRTRAAEYPVSFELIHSEDNSGLQQDAGIRLQGSSYRRRTIGPNPSAKWSFKVYFRDAYDDRSWLEYPLIERSSVDRYKSITLRSGYNDPSNPFIKDELGRRLHQDMGSLAAEGTFVNLFVNGQLKSNGYYNPTERHEEHLFQEKYHSELPWDVVSKWQPSGTAADPPRSHSEPYYFDVRDGDEAHFAEMLDYALAHDLAQPAHYEEMARRLDIPQFVDYLILQGYSRIRDWPHNNWNAARERSDGELGKWRFYAWDLEFGWGAEELTGSFKTPGNDSYIPINILYGNLVANAEFRQLFADRAAKHFFHGGALTAENVRMRFDELRQEMRGVLPDMSTYIRDTFAPRRPGYVLASMVSQGLFTFEGPRFQINGADQHGGQIDAGDLLQMVNSHGSATVYYTFDGSDPRLPGGAVHETSARVFDGSPLALTGSTRVMARTLDGDTWSALSEATFFATASQVAGRHVFYNRSAFDGNDAGANAADAGAIAPDKQALLPSETAGVANYTSYSRGLNGIMVDIACLPDGALPGAEDFELRVGNTDEPADWAAAANPIAIAVRPGEGVDGSDRITIVWDDYAIARQWLQVTVLATSNTGLAEPDVFYFGNAVGESGNATADAKVNATDMLLARNNPRNFLNPAPIDFAYDFDRDGRVNATDMLIARNNQTHFLNALRLISVPGEKTAAASPRQATGPQSSLSVVGEFAESSARDADWIYEIESLHARHESPAKRTGGRLHARWFDGNLAEPERR